MFKKIKNFFYSNLSILLNFFSKPEFYNLLKFCQTNKTEKYSCKNFNVLEKKIFSHFLINLLLKKLFKFKFDLTKN